MNFKIMWNDNTESENLVREIITIAHYEYVLEIYQLFNILDNLQTIFHLTKIHFPLRKAT